jgi:adenylate cyclase
LKPQVSKGITVRLFPNINYGTEAYPEKVARRLRAMNIAAWITAAIVASFAIRRLADPGGDKLFPGLINAGGAVCFAALPLLHRFSPVAAPLVFVGFAYGFMF